MTAPAGRRGRRRRRRQEEGFAAANLIAGRPWIMWVKTAEALELRVKFWSWMKNPEQLEAYITWAGR